MAGKTVFSDTPPQGTIVSAAFLNALNNHRHTGRDIDGEGALDYAVATGSNNAYVLTLSPALDAHVAGMPIIWKANHTNTGAATININNLGAISIKRPDGSALKANDIISDQLVLIIYDGTQFQLSNFREIKLIDFPVVFSLSGYTKLPNGLIIQWIYSWTGADGSVTMTFPIAFPNDILGMTVSPWVDLSEIATIKSYSKTGLVAEAWRTVTGAKQAAISIWAIVIGY